MLWFILKAFISSVCILILSWLFYLNFKIYYKTTSIVVDGNTVNSATFNQLKFLENYLKNGGGKDMQQIFPEGFIFINSLYGLSWYDFAKDLPPVHPLRIKAVEELKFVAAEERSEYATGNFSEFLKPKFGAFYTGWTSVILARLLALQHPQKRDSFEIRKFTAACASIESAIQVNGTPFVESYHGSAWPADMVLCIYALKLHDDLFTPKYSETIHSWVADVKSRLDPQTGLIPHSVDFVTGISEEGARGSSQSLMLSFLCEIDSGFAKEQYNKYKKLFFTTRFGLPGIREYPDGVDGGGDIDSGPVIFGVGGAASIVGLRTCLLFKDNETAWKLRNSMEAFGFPVVSDQGKKYLLGALPIADAFILWANIAGESKEPAFGWAITFHLYSMLILVLSLAVLYFSGLERDIL